MEEEKVEIKEEPKAEKELKISQSALAVCIALFSLFLIVLCSILRAFGVGSFTFYGIMSIVMYALPLAGATFSVGLILQSFAILASTIGAMWL